MNTVLKKIKVSLLNISADGKTTIVLPIKYKRKRKNRQDLEKKKINAKLIGTYVDNRGEEEQYF